MAKKTKKHPRPPQPKPAGRAARMSAGMKVPKLPDPVKLGMLRDAAGVPAVDLGGPPAPAFAAVAAAKTPGQLALEACGQWFTRLAGTHPAVSEAAGAMLTLRRAYAVAYRELLDQVAEAQLRLDTEGSGEAVPPEFADFVVQFAMWQASKPFTEHDLMAGVVDTLLPWLAGVVDAHSAADAATATADAVDAAAARRATALPIGFKAHPAQAEPTLGRDRALVLFGWGNAVRWLLDTLTAGVTAAGGFQVVRFSAKALGHRGQSAGLIRLPPVEWAGCANSDRTLDRMVFNHVAPTLAAPVDLLVVDDLSLAFTNGFVGRDKFAQAGDAHRRLRKWCDRVGAGMVAAVPTDTWDLSEAAEGSGPEQLKTFADLCPVAVEAAGPDLYRVTVGTHASVFDVPKATLDAYSDSRVVVPATLA